MTLGLTAAKFNTLMDVKVTFSATLERLDCAVLPLDDLWISTTGPNDATDSKTLDLSGEEEDEVKIISTPVNLVASLISWAKAMET